MHEPLLPDTFAFLRPIMRRCGAQCSDAEFHAAVNVTFHEHESEVYDQEHTDMWSSLPAEFNRLAEDCLRSGEVPAELCLLDIGCGTGLATDCLLKSPLGSRIRSVDLLDTSPRMLARAIERGRTWRVVPRGFEGLLDSLPSGRTYNLIVTCSVLHHVPDIMDFLGRVSARQPEGGFFLHLQDPNGDALDDLELRQRTSQAAPGKIVPEWAARMSPQRIGARLWRQITGRQGSDYISKTNRALLHQGVIRKPLTVPELFSITDVHVQDGAGISVRQMQLGLPGYQLIGHHSYGFFGMLRSSLPVRLQAEEDRLAVAGAQNGAHIGAAWKRPTTSGPGQ